MGLADHMWDAAGHADVWGLQHVLASGTYYAGPRSAGLCHADVPMLCIAELRDNACMGFLLVVLHINHAGSWLLRSITAAQLV